ncbi:hypothetical protein [Mesorhizobium sp. IMUNJ 23232]|uniref:hypothetical protein n=1 Tax=Mesorhizobium sp. IMUNJ 23232 TaxID=3376064 RepID=UPI0037B8138A
MDIRQIPAKLGGTPAIDHQWAFVIEVAAEFSRREGVRLSPPQIVGEARAAWGVTTAEALVVLSDIKEAQV